MINNEEAVAAIVAKIVEELQGSVLEMQLQKAAQVEVSKSNLRLTEVKRGVQNGLTQSGWERKLRNAVYQCLHKYHKMPHPLATPEHAKEPITYIRKAQVNWEKRILKSLNSMCTELNIPLARRRPDKDQRDILSRWTELGTDGPDVSHFRPVYAPKDFLEVVGSLKNPNVISSGDPGSHSGQWGILQVALKAKDIQELRLEFSELAINQCQAGIDDSPELLSEAFENERVKLARKVIAANHSPLAQEFAKKGCPISARAEVWCHILGVEIDDVDVLYYDQLKQCCLHHDLLVDSLYYKDVKLTAVNDDQYFVFEDYLYQVLLPFSRDTAVLKHFAHSSATPAKSYIRGKLGVEDFAVTYPPNGVIPFHGFSMYVAPLCFIYNDPVNLYFVFRQLYMTRLHKLHCLSSDPQGIVSLCLQFETLLQTHEPHLFYHLKSVGAQPLKIAFKWLIRAFSGYLSSDQVLLLWDRVLAYDSLVILSVLAAAIFTFRKTNLMQVQSLAAAEAVLADITTLKVIPLIQLCLFSK